QAPPGSSVPIRGGSPTRCREAFGVRRIPALSLCHFSPHSQLGTRSIIGPDQKRRNTAHSKRFATCVLLVLAAASCFDPRLARGQKAPAQNSADTNALRPFQIISTNSPPLPPSRFNPDSGVTPASTNIVRPEPIPRLNRTTT